MIEWLTFFMIMAVGQFSPGPDMILLTRVSLAEGRRAGWATACGIASGLMIHAGIAVSGLAFVLARNEAVNRWIKYLACGYLIWLAYQLMKSAMNNVKFKLDNGPPTRSQTSLAGYWRMGFLCNILNPKVAIFLAGVTLPFLELGMKTDLEIGDSAWAAILWATIFLEGWLLWSIWVWMLQVRMIKDHYQRNAHIIDGVFGMCLIALAVMLVLS